jgi:hypothetical protein
LTGLNTLATSDSSGWLRLPTEDFLSISCSEIHRLALASSSLVTLTVCLFFKLLLFPNLLGGGCGGTLGGFTLKHDCSLLTSSETVSL